MVGDPDDLVGATAVAGDERSEDITALHAQMLTAEGTPSESAVLALKKTGAWLLTGDISQSTDTGDYFGTLEIVRINSPAGCVSQYTIVDTPWGTIWTGPDDVWFMPFRALPIPIGRKIAEILKAQPEEQSYRIHAVYDDGFYKLALFSDGQGPNESTPLGEQWWLDLREGAPQSWQAARWYGPMVFKCAVTHTGDRGVDTTAQGTSFMTVDTRPGAGRKLVGVQDGLVPGFDSTGRQGISYVTYNNPGSRDIAGINQGGLVRWQSGASYSVGDRVVVDQPAFNNANQASAFAIYYVNFVLGTETSGVTEPNWTSASYGDNDVEWTRISKCLSPSSMSGSEALGKIHSKQHDFGTRMVEKLFQGMELSYFLTIPERFVLTQLVDGGTIIETIPNDLRNTFGPQVGTDFLEASGDRTFAEEFVSVPFYSDEDHQTLGRAVQLKLEESNGVCIPGDSSDPADTSLTFGVIIDGVNDFPVTLTSRYFASVTALIEAMVAAMNSNAALITAAGDIFEVSTIHTRLGIDNSAGTAWSPSIGVASSRYIWSLLGMTVFNDGTSIPQGTCTGDEIPFDSNIGDVSFEEATVVFRPFRRRPSV